MTYTNTYHSHNITAILHTVSIQPAEPTQASKLTYHVQHLPKAQSSIHHHPEILLNNKKKARTAQTMSKRSRGLSTSPPTDPSPLETRARSSSPASSTPQGRSKQLHLQDTTNSAVEVMRCSLPPHMKALSFASYVDYEVHYRQTHVNRCVKCGKNFPTDLFLNLHIEENHDSLMVARREREEKTVSVHSYRFRILVYLLLYAAG